MTHSTEHSPGTVKQTYWAVEIEPAAGGIVEYYGADRIELTEQGIRLFTQKQQLAFKRDQIRKILVMRTKKELPSSE